MVFLITGGAGFIGSNFLNKMVNKYPNDFYICFDKLTYAGNLSNLDKIKNNPNFKFIKGDITSVDDVENVFRNFKIDYVINFAAETHVDRSIDNPNIFLNTNVVGVSTLLNACKKFGIKRYHQVSTDEVYGDLPLNKPGLLFKEDSPLKPSSPYSASKASADLLCLAYYKTYNLPVTISRCSNNYGPYQFLEKLIPLMIDKAKNNEKMPIYGDGLNVRDWLYVDDHNFAIDLIVRNAKDGSIYNIGGNNEKNNLYIVKKILKELNKNESLICFVEDRKGHDRRYAIDSSKLQKELGWEPKTSFEEGIKRTISWYLNNPKRIDDLKSGEHQDWINKHYK